MAGDIWALRCKYLWALNQMCRLSPREVDNEMGWIDLIHFTIQIDDEDARRRRSVKTANERAEAAVDKTQMQRLSGAR